MKSVRPEPVEGPRTDRRRLSGSKPERTANPNVNLPTGVREVADELIAALGDNLIARKLVNELETRDTGQGTRRVSPGVSRASKGNGGRGA